MPITFTVNGNTFPDTYYPNGEITLVLSRFSDDVKYGVTTLPVGGSETVDDYDSGAFVMSMGGRTIKYMLTIDVVINDTSVSLWQVYQNFRKLFAGYTIGDAISITSPELGWTDKSLIIESHRSSISAGTIQHMTINMTLVAGDL